MMPKIEIGREGKNHCSVEVDGEEFCTIYGKEWKKKFQKLKEALCLLYSVQNLPIKMLNAVIKEVRK